MHVGDTEHQAVETGNLLNRCNDENCSEVSSNVPQDVGMHSKETKKTGKKGRVEAIGRDSVGL